MLKILESILFWGAVSFAILYTLNDTIVIKSPAQTVNTNNYLVFPTLAAALARSQQQCQLLGCDGVQTKYWWNVVPLSDGTAAIEVQPSGEFGPTAVKPAKPACAVGCGLSLPEQAQTKTAVQIGPLLPLLLRPQ